MERHLGLKKVGWIWPLQLAGIWQSQGVEAVRELSRDAYDNEAGANAD